MSESEEDNLEELEFYGEEPDVEIDDEGLSIAPDDVTEERAEESPSSEDSEDSSDSDSDSDEVEAPGRAVVVDVDAPPTSPADIIPASTSPSPPAIVVSRPEVLPIPSVPRSLSAAQLRRKNLMAPIGDLVPPGSYTVEAICALPHPVPTHALASSACVTHLLTGSDDGYIRDYDIFSSVNSKNFLTAPQRHHSGVVEGLMKSGQLRFWWANPAFRDESHPTGLPGSMEESPPLSPVYSLSMQSDALWVLAGTDSGDINLFTVRHEPGRLCYTMNAHRGPVSSLSMDHEERGFFSAGWDGEAHKWDLNTGQRVRTFTAHGAQLTTVALRPIISTYASIPSLAQETSAGLTQHMKNNLAEDSRPHAPDSDSKSDASFDPLFDDEPEVPDMSAVAPTSHLPQQPHGLRPAAVPPKNMPPILDGPRYTMYSADLLMTASIDGQILLWDCRVNSPGTGVGRLWMSEKTPPWCLSACWSADGGQMYAGRRNGTVDVWDVRQLGRSGPVNTPRLFKTLRNPLSSGVVSCVVPLPDCRHLACASVDNLRLWNVAEAVELDLLGKPKSGAQFKIIPGHHGGYISQLLVDPGGRFLVSASSNRGWHGDSTKTVFVHDIKRAQ